MADGWQPRPFQQFVLKVHSRCNLICDYCYVYTHADQSWRSRPRVMSPKVVDATARRIAEHAHAHGMTSVRVILHGGEPLLAGPDRLTALIETVRTAVGAGVQVEFTAQTNGVLLDRAFLTVLDRLGVRIGVSLDGGERANDRHRKDHAGRGSYTDVAKALKLLDSPDFRAIYAGILCTIDLANDPVETYEALAAFAPPTIDLLLPHGTWADPPPNRPADPTLTPYADWLIAVYDHWRAASSPATRIRLFEEIIYLLMGGTAGVEAVGVTPTSLVVVETDGTIEQSDFLKVVGSGAAVTGMNVIDNLFDDALFHPALAVRQMGLTGLAEECQSCYFGGICGGGHYAHRYRLGTGFRNPSVYCADLYRLIGHIHTRIQPDVRESTR
ncbi:FxsB family radical SAM/SPASM domain protein [Streptosporangiaceae bacterium NEAU-GS5]|nr:FxsB family radical SAM/SPASM domain protein [Streptosporangiaceae bacterium NEAU-GS5]